LLTRNLQDWSDHQPLLRLQKKVTKPEHATSKCLAISGAWTGRGRFLSAASPQQASLVGQQHTEIQGRSVAKLQRGDTNDLCNAEAQASQIRWLLARKRIREEMRGRKSYAERDPELVLAAKRLHRRSPKGPRRSLREIAEELMALGYANKRGVPYSASCIKAMVDGPSPIQLTRR
jgi:hypothetical protein